MGERVFLGLGSNLGERDENLREALRRVGELPATAVVQTSSFVESAPWGVTDQPGFLNAVAEIRTRLEPEALLHAVKEIEREVGRTPTYRWGPRLIDIDLLLYGAHRLSTAELTIPHPHLLARDFVTGPLEQIAPEILEELRRAAVSL